MYQHGPRHGYLAECATDDADKDLVVNHPVHLAMALSSVVAQRQIPIDQTVQKTVEIPQLDVIEKIVDTPVPQILEELAETSKVFPQDRVQHSSADETIEIPAVSLAEKMIEMLVTRTQDKTQHVVVVNTHVQHAVNAVEAEKPIINEKINQVTKHPEVPQIQVVEKTVEGPQLQIVEQIVETPETQTIQGIQTSESLNPAPFRQVHFIGVMKPDDPDAKIKFLAEEELHGVGGFAFDANGNRVANEMGGQNCVTGEMWKNKPPFSPALNKATSDDIAWQCTGRGVRKLHESGTALIEDMEAPVSKMPDSIEAHCQTVVAHRQVLLIQRVQKMVEVPRVRMIPRSCKGRPSTLRRES